MGVLCRKLAYSGTHAIAACPVEPTKAVGLAHCSPTDFGAVSEFALTGTVTVLVNKDLVTGTGLGQGEVIDWESPGQ